MTIEELRRIVCGCIADVGIAPADWEQTCGSTLIGDLGLDEDQKRLICRCVLAKLEDLGVGGTCGPGNFPDGVTVSRAAEVLSRQIL